MKGYYGRLLPFWEDDLKLYESNHTTPIAPHAIPHPNYEGIMLKQTFNDELPSCWREFYKELCVKDNGSVCWLTMEPGEIIPIHTDHFYMLKTKNNASIKDCIRYLVMLEDWSPGHYVQLDELILTDWKRGDVWYFDYNVQHWAANCGTTNFYSCQVSVVK